jgi:hypothetical protein
LHNATRHRAKNWLNGKQFQTKQTQRLKTYELRNGRKGGRGAAIRQEGNGRAKNGGLDLRNDFNPRYRNWNCDVGGDSFNLAMRDCYDGAIIIVFRNRSAVQPCVKRRVDFRRRHEQPYCERQHACCQVKTLAQSATNLVLAVFVLQSICNITSGVLFASDILTKLAFALIFHTLFATENAASVSEGRLELFSI